MATTDPVESLPTSRPDTIAGMAISLAFWLCLLASATLFAIVALSPKLFVYLQLRSQYDANQSKLVGLEQHADQLRRVVDAIRNDKDFKSELTRIEFDAVRPDEEVIPVDASLKLDARAVETPIPSPKLVSIWYEPGVKHLASDEGLRKSLLAAAGLLVIVSFSMLQPNAGQRNPDVSGGNSIWRGLRNRYVR